MENEDAGVGKSPEEQAQAIVLPDLESAIRNNAASFAQLAQTFFYSQGKHSTDKVTQLTYAKYYLEVHKAFEIAHGAMRQSYWCTNITAGIVLTDKGEIHWAGLPAPYLLLRLSLS